MYQLTHRILEYIHPNTAINESVAAYNWNVSLNFGDQVLLFDFEANCLFLSFKWGPTRFTSTNGLNIVAVFHRMLLAATTEMETNTHIQSNSIWSKAIPFHPILFNLISSNLISSNLLYSHVNLSHIISTNLIQSYLISFNLIKSHVIVSNRPIISTNLFQSHHNQISSVLMSLYFI